MTLADETRPEDAGPDPGIAPEPIATPANTPDAPETRVPESGVPAPAGESPLPTEASAQEGQPAGTPAAAAAGPDEAATGEANEPPHEAQADRPDDAAKADAGRPTVVVRYGAMGMLGRFTHSLEQWRCGQRAVIKSDRGMEIGTIVCKWDGCGAPATVRPQIKGEVVRVVTHVDEIEERHLLETAARERAFCQERIAERQLPMKLVDVEHLFGGDRVIFYFVSESRVDFRALVRDLAHEFQTRIEMRQIGVRDEARLLGDYERCGRPLCCRAWIKELEPVSMKMAKVQKATLDPTKISGRCGRLMCCLRFEHATYRELAKNLPRKNAIVGTQQGLGKVIGTDVVTQIVGVVLEGGARVNVPVECLLEPDAVPTPAKTPSPEVNREAAPRDAAKPKSRTASGRRERSAPEPETKDKPEKAEPETPADRPGRRSRRGRRRSRRGGKGRDRASGGETDRGNASAGNGGKPDASPKGSTPDKPDAPKGTE